MKIQKKQKNIIKKKSKQSTLGSNKEKTKVFKCQHCGATYAKAVSLGGHQSKAHPGESNRYRKKIEIRESRTDDRQFLQKAKEWFKSTIKRCPKANRNLVTKIKK